MKDINEFIALKIRQYRAERKLTLKQLAEKVGITLATLQKYEAGKIQRIDVDMVIKLASALDVQPESLTGWNLNLEVPAESQNAFDKYKHLTEYQKQLVNNLIDGLSKENMQQ